MAWKGKIFGAVIGFLVTHNVWGAVLGACIGHLFDQSGGFGFGGNSAGLAGAGGGTQASISEVFFSHHVRTHGTCRKSGRSGV